MIILRKSSPYYPNKIYERQCWYVSHSKALRMIYLASSVTMIKNPFPTSDIAYESYVNSIL
jgi:hypothetical protein